MRLLALAVLVILPMLALQARSEDGPEGMKLVGEAQLDVLIWSVYHSQLYAPDGKYREDKRPLRLHITYLRDVDAKALVKQTKKEWAHLKRSHPNQEQWLSSLEKLWPDIKAQDTLVFELNEDDVSLFYHNDQLLGQVRDADFGEHFLAIWLSPDTSRPELRRALIGASES